MSGETFTWRLLSDMDTEAAEALQEKAYETDRSNHTPEYVCTRCREQCSYLEMRRHLRIRFVPSAVLFQHYDFHFGHSHAVDDPEIEEDYVLHVDASMDQPPFPLMLPQTPPEIIELDDDDAPDVRLSTSATHHDCIIIDDDD